jgi:hypothetical protein
MGIPLQNGAKTRCSTPAERTKMALSVFLYSYLSATNSIASSLVHPGLIGLLAWFVLFDIHPFSL